eukprot:3215633-Pyramimonas_sp.AAC.1
MRLDSPLLTCELLTAQNPKPAPSDDPVCVRYGSKGVKAEYVVCDYSKFDEKARAKVSAALKPLEIGVLVNNVGVSYPYPKYFQNLTEEQVSNLMEMNVNSTTWMTYMVLPGMVERKKVRHDVSWQLQTNPCP